MLFWVAGITVGVAAEAWALGRTQPILSVLDFAVGVALIGIGGTTRTRAPGAGLLLAGAGLAWFVGTVVPDATYWHRGLLVHLLVSYPKARPASRAQWAIVAIGYAAAIVDGSWANDATGAALAAAAEALCLFGLRLAAVRRSRYMRISGQAGLGIAAVVLAGCAARLIAPPGTAALPSLLAYEASLVMVAVHLWAGVRPPEPIALTNLVIEVAGNRSATLRDALAELLEDPTLRLGHWQASRAGYVDGAGLDVTVPPAGGDRTLTRIDRDGGPFAALVHDSAFIADSSFVDAIAVAERLTAANAALQAEIRARVDEVAASRLRLQRAADEERRRLERRLATGPEHRLEGLLRDLQNMSKTHNSHLDRAADQLAQTLIELHDAALGLYPHELSGRLWSGLIALADRCPVPVTVSVGDRRFAPQVEVAAYYVCAEALTNVTKHARASKVSINTEVTSTTLAISVTDDGIGGASVGSGTGILGLVDRVESVGGRLTVVSKPGAGTELTAEIPLDGRPWWQWG